MKDAKLLFVLIYCTKCFTKHDPNIRFYIGECMHILCQSCFNTRCPICSSTNFIILTDQFINKLLQNPSETHVEPIDTAMFQLSSALTLINKQKTEIQKLKGYVKKFKEEKHRKNQTQNTKGLFCFNKDVNDAKHRIDQIYEKNRSIEKRQKPKDSKTVDCGRSNVRSQKTAYLNSITNQVGRKKLFTDYDRRKVSMSSSKSMRVTVPKQESEFKYVFRKHNDF